MSTSSFLIVFFVSLTLSISTAQILFPFGDSLYDVGNTQFLTKETVPATTWPYGMSVDKPSGRWSDGKVVPDFIAGFMNIQNEIPPILKSNANLTSGANFAVAGATVTGTPANTLTLAQQVSKFIESKGNWTDAQIKGAIFLFYIGADDYLIYNKANKFSLQLVGQSAIVDQVMQGIKDALVALYQAGARKFSFQNLAPLGCLPVVKQEYKTADDCLPSLSQLAVDHNVKLNSTLVELSLNFPAFTYNIFDYYNATVHRLNDGFHYRYLEVNKACCGIGTHNGFGCAFKNVHSNMCDYQRGYLFYDGRHNAEKTNEAMAHMIFSADPIVIRPMNLRELFVYPKDTDMLEH